MTFLFFYDCWLSLDWLLSLKHLTVLHYTVSLCLYVTRRPAAFVSDTLLKTNLFRRYYWVYTHSAVEMLHDSALYKFMTDIGIDIGSLPYHALSSFNALMNDEWVGVAWAGVMESYPVWKSIYCNVKVCTLCTMWLLSNKNSISRPIGIRQNWTL